MNHEYLDKKLRMLTESELKYRYASLDSIYPNGKTIIKNGVKAYIFDIENGNKGFLISKHSRFSEVPMHVHSYVELSYVYSGTCSQTINDQHIILTEGQVCIIDTDTPHSIDTTNENDIIINIIMSKSYFSTAFLSRLSQGGIISNFLINAISEQQSHDNYIIFNSQHNTRIPFLFRELMCEYFDKSICASDIMDSYMIIIFSELLKTYQEDTCNNSKLNKKNPIIPILNYIEKNYTTCTLKSVANNFNFHPNYLSMLIKKNTNKTFKELVQSKRLNHAAFLLSNSTLPIYEIANSIGYDNLSFFYRKFKEYYNVSPNEYRKFNKKL